MGGRNIRRLRKRGRPSRSKKEQEVTPLFAELSKVIKELEKKNPSKRRGRPSKLRIGSVMQFNSPPEKNTSHSYAGNILPYPQCTVTVITPNLRTNSSLIYSAPDCFIPGIESFSSKILQTIQATSQPPAATSNPK